MHLTPPTPIPKPLPAKPKHDPKKTPQRNEAHVRHDGRHVTLGDDPGRDEFGEAVAPDVFVDGDADEDGAADGLVAVDGVGGGDGGEGSYLDAGAGEADDYNCLGFCALLVMGLRKGGLEGRGPTFQFQACW